MEDIEIVRKCAVAIGLKPCEPQPNPERYYAVSGGGRVPYIVYDPLHDKAQAMDLVIKFGLFIDPPDWQPVKGWNTWQVNHYAGGKVTEIRSEDLLRAICECVANIKGKT
jgi:hypothetical protein